MIARAGRPGWRRRHGAAVERRRVADGRGWADDINGAQGHGLVLLLAGHRTGRAESCGVQRMRVECKLVSVVATAAVLRGIGEMSWLMT